VYRKSTHESVKKIDRGRVTPCFNKRGVCSREINPTWKSIDLAFVVGEATDGVSKGGDFRADG
jgi:hypothetical protein